MPSIPFSHVSVLLNECIEGLNIRDGFTYIDCTTGGGGHSYEIAKRLGENGRLICIDRDEDALSAAKERLAPFSDKITFVHANFSELRDVIREYAKTPVGGVLMDLGCSSFQFDAPERGFSYNHNAPLDMRMDRSSPLNAHTVVNTYPEAELRRILFEYGEERFAPRIAARIAEERSKKTIETTFELSDIIKSAIPKVNRIDGPHPAKRSFQAIRIEVNGELSAISPTIHAAVDALAPEGRCVIISFHSLEDRIVKESYADLTTGCTCPRDFPVCVCGKAPKVKLVNKKPILPGNAELAENPRSRSAKLRIAEKL